MPVPVLTGPGEALVRPVAVATCDLDTMINAGSYPLPLPYALGHEFVAEVLTVSEGVTVAAPGDLVVVPFQISCGVCRSCRRGRTGDCNAVPPLSAYGLGAMGGDWGGAVSDVVRVPFADAMLVPMPPGVDPAAAASADNLTDAWRTVAPYLSDTEDDRRVLVFGAWSIGLYAVAIARALGAAVTYVDDDPGRLAVAEQLGATAREVAENARLELAPLTVHTTGRPGRLRQAIKATEPGGTLVDTGIFPAEQPMPLMRMYTTGLTFVTGRAQCRRDLPAVLDLIAAGALAPSVVTGHTAGWSDAPAAWAGHTHKLVLRR
ncbi:zinc-dependent alcohol dehydrogenase [Cryptosporangium minutisporangium]|uniref:zinc-dependent alcohol dehydrogenase n=1 Tax=Cryptosporangium minutisporangium TaxID=113569 RepID=UPI0031ECF1E3